MQTFLRSPLGIIILVILSLPILLHVFNPSLQLGGFGLLLGVIGMTISPIIIFIIFPYLVLTRKK